jgi:hypothetical protein
VKAQEIHLMGEKIVDWFSDEIVNGIRTEKTTTREIIVSDYDQVYKATVDQNEEVEVDILDYRALSNRMFPCSLMYE